jgi:bifunctional non-homologous end joining protein LigD
MSDKSKFVLMKHEALKAGLHFDLRFRIPGSKNWNSFAIRKGIPKGNEKVLAVKTTVHSENDALFIGKIPEGEYGGGTLSKFDSGSCDILKYDIGRHIVIRFNGSKLDGIYHFISMSTIGKGKQNQYLFFKGKLP